MFFLDLMTDQCPFIFTLELPHLFNVNSREALQADDGIYDTGRGAGEWTLDVIIHVI